MHAEESDGMNYHHITYDLAATVAAQVRAGKTLQKIARDMHITVEVAAAAFSRWNQLEKNKGH